jgi:hypothetical protein
VFGWFKGKQFAPPEPPLRDYWVTMQVSLKEPLPIEGGPPAVGYFRILGMRCTPLHLRSFIEESATDGSVVWGGDSTHWSEVVLNDLDRALRRTIDPRPDECVWHKMGRIYFPADGA